MRLTVKYAKGKKFEVISRSHHVITDQPNSEGGTDQGMTPVEILIASLTSFAAFYTITFFD